MASFSDQIRRGNPSSQNWTRKMIRNSVGQFFRRCRSQYRASQIGDTWAYKATLCGVGGYVLGGLMSKSLSEEDLRAEQSVISLHHYADEHQSRVEKFEKEIQKLQSFRFRSS